MVILTPTLTLTRTLTLTLTLITLTLTLTLILTLTLTSALRAVPLLLLGLTVRVLLSALSWRDSSS